jgi:hypothetical protein
MRMGKASCIAIRPKPRHQAADVFRVFDVCVSEAFSKHWLFERRDVKGVENKKRERPNQMWHRSEKERVRQENEDHAGDHWIPDEAIWPGDDQHGWRIPRGQRASSSLNEVHERVCKEPHSDGADDHTEKLADPADRVGRERERCAIGSGEPHRDHAGDNPGQADERNQLSQNSHDIRSGDRRIVERRV